MLTLNRQPSIRDLRWFAGLMLPFMAFVAWGLWRRTGWTTLPAVLVIVAAIVTVVGLWHPLAIRPVYRGWTCAFYPVGWIVSHVILAATFYLVLTPLGLLLRLCGIDPMQRKWDRQRASYWIDRPPPPPAKSYYRQF